MEKYICATLDLSKSLSNFSSQVTKYLELTNITEWNGKILAYFLVFFSEIKSDPYSYLEKD
jgi:hypothetical protein